MQSLLGLVLLTRLAIANEPPGILAETSPASCRCGGAPPLGGWPARRCAPGHQGRPRQPDGEICSQWGWKFHSYSQNSIWILTSARGRPFKLSLHVGAEDQKRCNSAVLLWACEIAILNEITSVPAAPRMNLKETAKCSLWPHESYVPSSSQIPPSSRPPPANMELSREIQVGTWKDCARCR